VHHKNFLLGSCLENRPGVTGCRASATFCWADVWETGQASQVAVNQQVFVWADVWETGQASQVVVHQQLFNFLLGRCLENSPDVTGCRASATFCWADVWETNQASQIAMHHQMFVRQMFGKQARHWQLRWQKF
jgi:wyosine [tRNA(Phe)-imidazoG37] synthetase (radical SAM superfamily)